MNIFLPYENDISKSVGSLDDVRLNKQAVECYQLLDLALREKENGGEIKTGHCHHPVYLFYKNNLEFLAFYGYECCREYYYRFKKWLKLTDYFDFQMQKLQMFDIGKDGYIQGMIIPKFAPFYMEGSAGQPNYIRATENVSELFRNKLCKKWDNDKSKGRQPKWTSHSQPKWYTRGDTICK